MAQRSFRVQQLQELDTVGADAEPDAARREVRLALRHGSMVGSPRDRRGAAQNPARQLRALPHDAATRCPWSGSVPCR